VGLCNKRPLVIGMSENHQRENARRAFATIRQIDNGDLWVTFLTVVILDQRRTDPISSQKVSKVLEETTGSSYENTPVDRWLHALTDEYYLLKQPDDQSEDHWQLSKKGQQFVDLVVDDTFLDGMSTLINNQSS
jgi:hypothetical protein